MKKSFVSKYIKNKYSIVIAIILLIIVYFIFFSGKKTQTFDVALVRYGNIEERVSVTGKVSSVEKSDLSFEKSGKITSIKVKVGDRVKKGDILSTLDSTSDRANLNSALAKLADMTRSLNAPELASEEAKLNVSKTSLENAKADALNVARSSLTLTQSALFSYADNFFDNPQSVNPTINIRTQSVSLENEINNRRATITDFLNNWKNDLSVATSTDKAQSLINSVSIYQAKIKAFADQLNVIVNDLNSGNSGLTRTSIDSKISTINSAMTTLNQSTESITSAKTALNNSFSNYDQTYSNFLLKSSGSSAEAVLAQRSVVEAYKAELEKNTLKSSIDGIVTKAEPEIGEFVSPGSVQFSIINDSQYKIEAYVPEADIAKIKIGDHSSTTLDAYGQSIDFPTAVTFIDPAETILEGVPTYKITLQFVYNDSRIRSGMTANLDILTASKNNVLIVPTRAVIVDEKNRSIRLVDETGKKYKEIPIEIGLKGSDGMTQVLTGLREGDKVVTYIK